MGFSGTEWQISGPTPPMAAKRSQSRKLRVGSDEGNSDAALGSVVAVGDGGVATAAILDFRFWIEEGQ
jgi:hypothetical protein